MSFLSGSKTKQSTSNQQVVVSGSGVGISGTYGNIGSLTVTTSDAETVQAALSATQAVAQAAVTGGNLTAIGALATLERQQDRNNAMLSGALEATQNLATQVAPVSEGNIISNLSENNTKTVVAAVAALVIIGGIVYFKK